MQRPQISTNFAISADGKISSVSGIASGWTSKADHARLLVLRESADALIVGRGTLESDQMTMTVPGKDRQPLRCIVSRNGVFNSGHPIFSKPGGAIHLLVTGDSVAPVPSDVTVHRQSLREFLHILSSDYQIQHLHCEGGGQLIKELAELDLIDEFHLTIGGHTLFGGLLAPTATGMPSEPWLDATRSYKITHYDPRTESGECFLTYTRQRDNAQ